MGAWLLLFFPGRGVLFRFFFFFDFFRIFPIFRFFFFFFLKGSIFTTTLRVVRACFSFWYEVRVAVFVSAFRCVVVLCSLPGCVFSCVLVLLVFSRE